MNICTELSKRGLIECDLFEDEDLWNAMKDCYTLIGEHGYDPKKEARLKLIIAEGIDVFQLVQYAKEHNETEFLKELTTPIN